MRYIYSWAKYVFLPFCLVFYLILPASAQQDITVKDSKQFVVRYYKKANLTRLTVDVTYEKKEGKYKLKLTVADQSDSFDLKSPLNIEFFRLTFNEKINKIASNTFSVSQGTIQEVFIWIYSITDALAKAPISGKLLLNTHVIILSDKNRDEKQLWNFDYRAEKLNAAMGDLNEQLSLTRQLRLKLIPDSTAISAEIPMLDFGWKGNDVEEKVKIYMTAAPTMPVRLFPTIWSSLSQYYEAIKQTESKAKVLAEQGIFPIKSVSIQLERGFLERIQVEVPSQNGRDIIFENIFAIGFSSVKNFRSFEHIRLVPRNGNGSEIYLSDIFANYDNLLDNYTRDYSPADTSINGIAPEAGSVLELRRERYVNLFDSKIYTDLNGFDQNSPNGLVQIELSRRFNLKTSRQQVTPFRSDVGFLTYLNTYGSYNKIEQDQKYLKLKNANRGRDGILISPSYATNLDFRRYENFSLGTELNTFLFDWPDGKLTFFIDMGARYGHTPVVDYLRQVNGDLVTTTTDSVFKDAHTFTWYPKIALEIFAEKRVGLVLTYQFNKTYLFSNNEFKQVTSYAKSDVAAIPVEYPARKSHMLEFYLRAETTQDKNGRMFLRARFFLQHKDINTFFPQFQLGYAYNLAFKK